MLDPKEMHIKGDFCDMISNNDSLYLWTINGALRSFNWRSATQK
jgi:hypothetical protein